MRAPRAGGGAHYARSAVCTANGLEAWPASARPRLTRATARSAVLEPRRLLGEEGAHALGAIRGPERAMAQRQGCVDRFALRSVERHADRLLAQLQRHARSR